MGIGGISVWQLLIVLAIVIMLFGTKRLRNLGGDLGGAVKGFKKAMDDDKTDPEQLDDKTDTKVNSEKIIDGDSEKVSSHQDK